MSAGYGVKSHFSPWRSIWGTPWSFKRYPSSKDARSELRAPSHLSQLCRQQLQMTGQKWAGDLMEAKKQGDRLRIGTNIPGTIDWFLKILPSLFFPSWIQERRRNKGQQLFKWWQFDTSEMFKPASDFSISFTIAPCIWGDTLSHHHLEEMIGLEVCKMAVLETYETNSWGQLIYTGREAAVTQCASILNAFFSFQFSNGNQETPSLHIPLQVCVGVWASEYWRAAIVSSRSSLFTGAWVWRLQGC